MLLPRPFGAALVGLSVAACHNPDAFSSAAAVRDPVLARSAVDNLGVSGGFKGAAGIQTSPEYCAARIWPDNDARTWPVTAGNISVRP